MEGFVVGAIVVGVFAVSLYLFSYAEILIENDMLRKEKEQAEKRNKILGKELELAHRRFKRLSLENLELRDQINLFKDRLEEERKRAERKGKCSNQY